jgi:hypothetical protein
MLNANRIFFIVLSNVGVRLFRLGIYSTSNSQRASAARGLERAHTQKHPTADQCASTVIKRERTTDLKLANFPRELAATLAALPSTSPIPSAPFMDVTDSGAHAARVLVSAASPKQSSISLRSTRMPRRYLNQENKNPGNGTSEIETRAARVAASESGDERQTASCVRTGSLQVGRFTRIRQDWGVHSLSAVCGRLACWFRRPRRYNLLFHHEEPRSSRRYF